MLRSIRELEGYKIHAKDGGIGIVSEFYFDDQHWVARYLVADTGTWLSGRKVLISTRALGHPDWNKRIFPVLLLKRQIQDSPDIDSKVPVSRRSELRHLPYHEWPVYWNGLDGLWYEHPVLILPARANEGVVAAEPPVSGEEKHLQSTGDTKGLRIEARDGEIGHLDDFIVDDENWSLRYLVVATRNWLPGKRVLMSPGWIRNIDWSEDLILIDHSVGEVKNSPPFNPAAPVNRVYEQVLYDYYGRPHYWDFSEAKPVSFSKKERSLIMSQEKERNKIWVDPSVDCDCRNGEDQDAYHMTYELPGVKKEDIQLKVTKEALRLSAAKNGMDFVNEFCFSCDADVENVHASYENGLLTVEVPLDCPDPFKSAKAVAVA